MKFKNMISFTISNAFILFLFASLLASCNKKNIPKTGLFSTFKVPNRSIASTMDNLYSPSTELFMKFQDPSQILVFCHQNSSKIESCYNENLEKILIDFAKNNKNQNHIEKIAIIRSELRFETVNENFNSKVYELKNKLELNIIAAVKDQYEFCLKNAKIDLKKCVSKFKARDTFKILNKFQYENKMNGNEYLFVKNVILEKYQEQSEQISKSQNKTI